MTVETWTLIAHVFYDSAVKLYKYNCLFASTSQYSNQKLCVWRGSNSNLNLKRQKRTRHWLGIMLFPPVFINLPRFLALFWAEICRNINTWWKRRIECAMFACLILPSRFRNNHLSANLMELVPKIFILEFHFDGVRPQLAVRESRREAESHGVDLRVSWMSGLAWNWSRCSVHLFVEVWRTGVRD